MEQKQFSIYAMAMFLIAERQLATKRVENADILRIFYML